MAETLLSFGVRKLWDLLARESQRLQGFDEQFSELKRDLNLLRFFLEDADAKKHTNKMVRTCVEEIKEIVFDAEDIVETFLLNKELGQTSGVRKRMRRLSCIIVDRRNIDSDIGVISKRISKVISDMQLFGVQQMIVDGDKYSLPVQEIQREMRKTFPSNNENELVGLEENVKKLVGYLVEEDSIQVVSITGMGGIGKTTLARQVFNHEMVQNHFDGVVWVCISQQFTRTYVWQTILQQLSSKHDEHREANMTEDDLQKKLFQLLETSNSLIVLDDMWREEDWDRIEPVFPPKKGWKVLLTSRNEKVALRADPTCVTFKPECLTIEESWTLFRRITFPRKDTSEYIVDEEMEEMGKKMIKHCGGLPLAVKVLGGLLAAQHTLTQWKRVFKNIGSHIVGGFDNDQNISSVYHILSLSFEELPIYLKQCFLYFAHFPEDYPIHVSDLAYFWAAEGIPRPRYYDGATLREVANGYIEELVKRNMVISKRDVGTGTFETCHLHDMMREVCLRKAEEENFVHIVDIGNSQSPCTSRRIALHQLGTYHPNPKCEIQNPKLRSLLIIKKQVGAIKWMASGVCFTKLQLMRVLDLSCGQFKRGKLPSSIGKLIHLRYLSLYGAMVTRLPSSMRNLRKLLYLDLSTSSFTYIPNFLKEMQELAYLSLPREIHDKTKLDLGNLVKLETLVNFSTKNSSVKDLQRMTKLRILSINIRGEGCTMENLSSSLSELRHLEDLRIYDFTNDKKIFVLDCVHLRLLKLRIYMPRLPDEHHFPSHLTTISLTDCRLVEDPMPTLEKLLELKELELGYESFCGRRMLCSNSGFPQLHRLQLRGLNLLEEWIVEHGSMPLLHTLYIFNCKKLKELPNGFPQLHRLHLANLDDWEEWIVEDSYMPLLHSLIISNCPKFKKLPDWQHFPSHLTTINLFDCHLVEDPMPTLEKLLHLKEVTLPKSFCGRKMVCSGGGFPQLQRLHLSRLEEWEEWIVEEGSMPRLHSLYISDCYKLKELPDGLRFVKSLKSLSMDEEWKERLLEGGEDYYKVKHISSVTYDNDYM